MSPWGIFLSFDAYFMRNSNDRSEGVSATLSMQRRCSYVIPVWILTLRTWTWIVISFPKHKHFSSFEWCKFMTYRVIAIGIFMDFQGPYQMCLLKSKSINWRISFIPKENTVLGPHFCRKSIRNLFIASNIAACSKAATDRLMIVIYKPMG